MFGVHSLSRLLNQVKSFFALELLVNQLTHPQLLIVLVRPESPPNKTLALALIFASIRPRNLMGCNKFPERWLSG